MKLTFFGGVGTVTGSKYLLETGSKRVLVDCGLFQGKKELRLQNWAALPIDPKTIDTVLITHAHIDHTGYIPLLVKNGFKGRIYATEATIELCKILLPDSGYLQEEDARRANKYGYTKHAPALPLYTKEEAIRSLDYFVPVSFEKPVQIFKDFQASWHRAGHILGASFIHCRSEETRILFSGDIGRLQDPIMKPPVPIEATDYLVIESTYGDRLHEVSNPMEKIARVINRTVKRGGTILIPAFAVGRAQALLYYISKIKEANLIPDLPIYLDSPMAIDATKIMHSHPRDHHLSKEECRLTCQVAKYVNTAEESKWLDSQAFPKVIISASGMATGGRVLHHLKVFAPDQRNTILLSGYQAAETRGASILEGKPEVKIHGEWVPIRAEVANISELSAHADYEEILTWMKGFQHSPRKVFITHGEPNASLSLKKHIEDRFGWPCSIPKYLTVESL
ncbi:MAG: MBL fold metallo-hydrolase [Alphaproteobacteria bacterium]|nr:MBL fold metallo-hydrolase [Alphaproteobacteria bacterium]